MPTFLLKVIKSISTLPLAAAKAVDHILNGPVTHTFKLYPHADDADTIKGGAPPRIQCTGPKVRHLGGPGATLGDGFPE